MNNRTKGIACILSAALCFAVMGAFVRLAGDVPSIQKSFFRNLIALLVCIPVLVRSKTGYRLRRSDLPYLFLRAGFGTVGLLCNFYALDHLVIADASMLNKMSPFFAILFSCFVLNEKPNFLQGLAVAVAFGGSLLIIKPSFANADLGAALLGLLGGAGAGFAYTMVRVMGKRGIPGPLIVFFFSAFSTLVTLPYVLAVRAPMTAVQLACLVGAGIAAAGGQFSITAAYCFAPARELSVYDYSQILFSAVLGFWLFDQVPDWLSLFGYLLIIGMAVVMFVHNRREPAQQEN